MEAGTSGAGPLEDYQHQLSRVQNDSDGFLKALETRMRLGRAGTTDLALFDQFGRLEQRLTLNDAEDFCCCVLLVQWLGDIGGVLGGAYCTPQFFGGEEAATYLKIVTEMLHSAGEKN